MGTAGQLDHSSRLRKSTYCVQTGTMNFLLISFLSFLFTICMDGKLWQGLMAGGLTFWAGFARGAPLSAAVLVLFRGRLVYVRSEAVSVPERMKLAQTIEKMLK